MKPLPPYTLVHRPTRRNVAGRRKGRGAVRVEATPRTFEQLTVGQFAQAIAGFAFRRQVNDVHLHHTWRPNHAQYRGHQSIVAMWRFHTETNGWSDIAQHVSVGPEGTIWTGRDWNVPPASAAGHNGNAAFGPFMIEMIGDFDVGHDIWEGEQRTAALAVIGLVQQRFGLAPQALRFHSQMSAKTCPGSSIGYDEVVGELERRHAAPPVDPPALEPGTAVRARVIVPAPPARMERSDAEPSEGGRLERAIAAEAATRTTEAMPAAVPFPAAAVSAERPAAAGAIRVGLWDLDAYVGGLPRVIKAVNAAQDAYAFFESMAAIPSGMISDPRRVRDWYRERMGSSPRSVKRNVIADDFFQRANVVRNDLGLGYLAGITANMLADEDDEQVYWNYFATSRGRLLLVSSYDLREYAREAGRTFEAAVLGVSVAQLLVARHRRLSFHESRGCLFDANEDRASIVEVLRHPRIEPSCLALIAETDRAPASALVSALDAYAGGEKR